MVEPDPVAAVTVPVCVASMRYQFAAEVLCAYVAQKFVEDMYLRESCFRKSLAWMVRVELFWSMIVSVIWSVNPKNTG